VLANKLQGQADCLIESLTSLTVYLSCNLGRVWSLGVTRDLNLNLSDQVDLSSELDLELELELELGLELDLD